MPRFHHTVTVPMGLDDAWKLLQDVEKLERYLPGTSLTSDGPGKVHGVTNLRFGPLDLRYQGTGSVTATDAAERRVVMEAAGARPDGSGRVAATINAQLQAVDASNTTIVLHTDLRLAAAAAGLGKAKVADVGAAMIGQVLSGLGNGKPGNGEKLGNGGKPGNGGRPRIVTPGETSTSPLRDAAAGGLRFTTQPRPTPGSANTSTEVPTAGSAAAPPHDAPPPGAPSPGGSSTDAAPPGTSSSPSAGDRLRALKSTAEKVVSSPVGATAVALTLAVGAAALRRRRP